MRSKNFYRAHARSAACILFAALTVLATARAAGAASWKGIEPFVSTRADVERILGAPVADRISEDGTLKFNVTGGKVTIFFVTPKFVAAKRLSLSLEGTVLQIVLSHDSASDTPESMNLVKNDSFKREARGEVEVYTNEKDGVIYTFITSRLKTTRYAYSTDQLARIQRGK